MIKSKKPLAAALTTAFVVGSLAPIASADSNPFTASPMQSGYEQVNKGEEGKCGEGKCGDEKDKEGKCGEGKCGDAK